MTLLKAVPAVVAFVGTTCLVSLAPAVEWVGVGRDISIPQSAPARLCTLRVAYTGMDNLVVLWGGDGGISLIGCSTGVEMEGRDAETAYFGLLSTFRGARA